MPGARGLLVVWILLGTVTARAQVDDPDTEVARRYFDQGRDAYAAGDYRTAIERFSAARRVKPLPAFDYNLARCHDRLDQPRDAIAAYQRYLDAEPNGASAVEVRERLAVLRARVGPPPAQARTPVYKKWWLWTIVGGVVVAGAVTTAVLLTVPTRPWQTTQPVGPGVSQALLRW